MLQALLEDPFKLVFHCESRNMSAYVLLPAKGGLKLKALADSHRAMSGARRVRFADTSPARSTCHTSPDCCPTRNPQNDGRFLRNRPHRSGSCRKLSTGISLDNVVPSAYSEFRSTP
jgi:uncharacterized protein (TIGR03435 family)